MKWIKTLIWAVVFVLAILFSMQNREEVILRFSLHPFFNWEREVQRVPLFLAILFSILLGVLIGWIMELHRRVRLKKNLRQHQKTIENLQREVESLSGSGSDQPPSEKI